MSPSALVQKLWNYCNILRDDGLSYGDYVEQLTYLLFLKMADEQSRQPFKKPSAVPKGYDWPSLLAKDGDDLEAHYRHVLDTLGKRKGMLGVIFRKAQNKVQDPAKLRRLIVDLIDKEQWSRLRYGRFSPRRAHIHREAPGSRSGTEEAASNRFALRHRTGGRRHAPVRDEPAPPLVTKDALAGK